MADSLSVQQIATFREAFDLFDVDGTNHVPISDLGPILRLLGHNPTDTDMCSYVSSVAPADAPTFDFAAFLSLMSLSVLAPRGDDFEFGIVQAFLALEGQQQENGEEDGHLPADDVRELLQSMEDQFCEEEVDDMISSFLDDNGRGGDGDGDGDDDEGTTSNSKIEWQAFARDYLGCEQSTIDRAIAQRDSTADFSSSSSSLSSAVQERQRREAARIAELELERRARLANRADALIDSFVDLHRCHHSNNSNDKKQSAAVAVDLDGADADSCSFCLEEFSLMDDSIPIGSTTATGDSNNTNPLALLPVCRHVFHAACLKVFVKHRLAAFATEFACPLCRSPVSSSSPAAASSSSSSSSCSPSSVAGSAAAAAASVTPQPNNRGKTVEEARGEPDDENNVQKKVSPNTSAADDGGDANSGRVMTTS